MVDTWKEVDDVVDDVVIIDENARRKQTCDKRVGVRKQDGRCDGAVAARKKERGDDTKRSHGMCHKFQRRTKVIAQTEATAWDGFLGFRT